MTDPNKPSATDGAINDEALDNVAGGHHHHDHDGGGLGFIAGAILGGVVDAIVQPNVHFGVPPQQQYAQQPPYGQPQYVQPQYQQPQYAPQYQQSQQQYAPQQQGYGQPAQW